jgi:RsmE family RNA methyltransferase
LPEVSAPVPVAAVVGAAGAVVADPAGTPIELLPEPPSTVVVGPEGGFTAEEIAGATLVTLGDLVLRVETAAVVAAALARRFR